MVDLPAVMLIMKRSIPLRPMPVAVGGLTGVGAAGGIAAVQRIEHGGVVDRAGQTAVATRIVR